MSNEVYANGREIACKAGSGKSTAAFPDVCLSPPSPPTGPVPIPYPVTAVDGDTDGGSKEVQISGKEVMLKNQSNFKKCTGDEASTKSLGMGVVTHTHKGKLYFCAWSMDVKIESMNAVRHQDLVTQNHEGMPGNTPTWPYLSKMEVSKGEGVCQGQIQDEKDACGHLATKKEQCEDRNCRKVRNYMLVPFRPIKGRASCCEGQTPHHLIEVHCFTPSAKRKERKRLLQFEGYDDREAPCVCCEESSRYKGDHGKMHAVQGMWERRHMDPKGTRDQMGGGGEQGPWTYGKAGEGALMAMEFTFPSKGKAAACVEAQLDNYHRQLKLDKKTPLRADRSPLKAKQKEQGDLVIRKLQEQQGGPAATPATIKT